MTALVRDAGGLKGAAAAHRERIDVPRMGAHLNLGGAD